MPVAGAAAENAGVMLCAKGVSVCSTVVGTFSPNDGGASPSSTPAEVFIPSLSALPFSARPIIV